ncbi:MAG: 3-methyl-2-oxobutanoate hydroxymethyltransferase [Chitinispirillia bacterium]|nr:3-methyl-2-oxobutanoate hydroxymethyltransferase [Chitinispirillia bacterium]MCL2241456.1 3-methyl-2-oxobutanoate hydroxymethyltransferase [Chitinispirillia bacterium]
MKKTLQYLIDKKRAGTPITVVTAYDYPTAKVLDEAGVDSVLVGDSVGTNCLGYKSEREVTIYDMIHHTSAVRRAVDNAFIIADLPYGTANSIDGTLLNARMLTDCGADCIKVEGWSEKAEIVKSLRANDFTVCAHMGYNPQIHDKPGVYGKNEAQAAELMEGARALCNAGAEMMVLEMVPAKLSGEISAWLPMPIIGIGSGNKCDGQVLVVNDLLGISQKIYKHARSFANFRETMYEAIKDYMDAVKSREFPGEGNSW